VRAVFLDYETVSTGDLDTSGLTGVMPGLQIYGSTSDSEAAGRIADAEIVLLNGFALTRSLVHGARHLRLIALSATGTDNVDLAAARERVRQLLTRYGLGQFLQHLPRQLSGGMRQRAALARTLCTNPDIVLLDEPFSALDSQTRLALADEITEILRREAKTVILVTHDIGEAISMAERVIIMSRRPGRIKSNHAIRFATANGVRPAPLAARNAPEFAGYFNSLWQELDVHVEH